MSVCPTCGQPVADVKPGQVLTERELVALSAWWWTGRNRAAAALAGVAVQTLKNQLYRARIRNGVETNALLAGLHLDELISKDDLLRTHNVRVREAA